MKALTLRRFLGKARVMGNLLPRAYTGTTTYFE